MTRATLDRYCRAWSLRTDGDLLETPTSWLRPVRQGTAPAMLKLLKPGSDEGAAAGLLAYYGGQGAVHLYRADGRAMLLERATGKRSLSRMAREGHDLEAAAILADTLARLHQERGGAVPQDLTPLPEQFASLFERRREDPLLAQAAEVAQGLFETARDIAPLHGDLHHENVLDGRERGWLAIDPKALIGERTYDVANLLRNPSAHPDLVHDPARMRHLADFYARRLGLPPARVLAFAFAHAGLSAAWDMEDGLDPAFSLGCTRILASLLPAAAPRQAGKGTSSALPS